MRQPGRVAAALVCAVLVALPSAHGWQLTDLPRDPEHACNRTDVRLAFTACVITGPDAKCCRGLDDVLADRKSVAAGCLCYPQVLYNVLQQANTFNYDVLSTLKRCRQQFNGTTPWAMMPPPADAADACPDIQLNDTAATLFMRMGDGPDAQVVRGAPRWAWSNMLQGGVAMGNKEMLWTIGKSRIAGYSCVELMFTVFMCIAPLFFIMHNAVLRPWSAVYRGLSPMQQLVTCQHAVYVLVLGVGLVPQSTLVIITLFRAWTADFLAGPEVTVLIGGFLASHAGLYMLEASVRSIRFSWLLLTHHQLFYVIIMLALWTENMGTLMIGLILDWFVVHEVPLYVVLVAYRLQWPRRLVSGLLVGACSWYVLTRVVQTVLLLYIIINWAQVPAIAHTPAFIITSILCAAFTFIQAYTLVIYKAIWVKVQRPAPAPETSPVQKLVVHCPHGGDDAA